MKATYMKRFQKLSHTLKNTDLMEHARMDERNIFSRKQKMPLKDILLSCLARKELTTTLEFRIYFRIYLWKYRSKAICSKGND